MLVLDTSALVYWTLDSEKLTARASEAIVAAETIAISSISIWEIGIKVKRSKLIIPISINEYTYRLQRLDNLEIVAVDELIWLENLALAWDHRDPADRTIVATARLLGSPLVTSDRLIAAFYPNTIW